MASRTGDVAGTVHEVVAAFDKAVNLVRRIEDRKDAKTDPEAVRDLFKSLSLGPVIVQGYFEADSKRLGTPYLIGDYQAQVELRDVLLGLKNLVGDLQDVLLDDGLIDFRQLQETSDACRSNAGVCLGQLSQRLNQAREPSGMHLQSPPPQYMSGVPSLPSPSLHYSSSRSTHSSAGGRMPKTPDPYTQHHALSPQWQSKRPASDDKQRPAPSRSDTETSLQETYGNLSLPSQPVAERDVDELSIRRPSSHTLAPEDGALLAPGPFLEGGQRAPVLPGQMDVVRDSYASFNTSMGSQSPVRQLTTNSGMGRERYGPDDFSPVLVEQHGPFRLDRDSSHSGTSHASRAFDGNHSTLERAEYRSFAEPKPLRLAHRPAQHPDRNSSDGPQGPPPRKPIPPVPYESITGHPPMNNASGPMPSHIYGQKFPIPPRSQSRPTPDGGKAPQRMLSPQTGGPPFQPSPQVQRAIQIDQARRQYNMDLSSQLNPQPPGPSFSSKPSQNSANTNSLNPTTTGHSMAQRELSQQASLFQSLTSMAPASASTSHPYVTPQTPQTPSSEPSNAPSISSASIPVPQNLPLNLPTDKSTAPYCKGAFRLFIGLPKKAFVAANRPLGMASMIPYWRCDKCLFEGPMHTAPGPLDKKGRPGKPEKIFDPTIRECGPLSTAVIGPDGRGEGSGGVRYRWVFLAKCHVPLKTMPEGRPDGTFGGYGCIFCTAEGAARGWTTSSSVAPGLTAGDAASTMSGKSGHSASSSTSGATPVFGNLQLFMDHLQMHRREENWPCVEMRGRMKCLVGRVAEPGEEWDINFLPL